MQSFLLYMHARPYITYGVHIRNNIAWCNLHGYVLYSFYYSTVMRIIKLILFPVPVRLRSGSGKLKFVVISPCFAIFKNVVHSLEPGETPSNSAFHQAPNNVQSS